MRLLRYSTLYLVVHRSSIHRLNIVFNQFTQASLTPFASPRCARASMGQLQQARRSAGHRGETRQRPRVPLGSGHRGASGGGHASTRKAPRHRGRARSPTKLAGCGPTDNTRQGFHHRHRRAPFVARPIVRSIAWRRYCQQLTRRWPHPNKPRELRPSLVPLSLSLSLLARCPRPRRFGLGLGFVNVDRRRTGAAAFAQQLHHQQQPRPRPHPQAQLQRQPVQPAPVSRWTWSAPTPHPKPRHRWR